MSSKRKRMRLPNGFGQISKISGNLRNPYRAMVTVGKNEYGRPICKLLKPKAYFKTYNEAYAALLEYNQNPFDFDDNLTMDDLYERWSERYYEQIAASSVRAYKAAWNYCAHIKDLSVSEFKPRHVRYCMEQDKLPKSIGRKIKILFNLMMDYAVENEMVERNFVRTMKISAKTDDHKKHMPFTDEEMAKIKSCTDTPFANIILIQCYSGWRPKEMGLLKIEDVDLERWVFTGGVKTKAGKNRQVPIYSAIRPLVKEFYDLAQTINSEYLFNLKMASTGKYENLSSYNRYRYFFFKTIKQLGLDPNHKPHDGRVHFVTIAKKYNVDEYALKYMVGHSITDLTESVYTKREIDWLESEIEKIK